MIEKYDEFRERLASLVDDGYREFSMKFISSERPFLGVRIPQIRELVKDIQPEYFTEFLRIEPVAIEEVLTRGIVISKLPYDELLKHFDSQIKFIDNWCTCDIFCGDVGKKIKKHRQEFFETKIENLINANHEFAVRVGLVLLKCAYVDFDYLALIFDRVENLREREEYYIKMAIAWLIAECFIKYPEETFAYLKVSKLPVWTFNKTISKICDSHRVDSETKVYLRKIRK